MNTEGEHQGNELESEPALITMSIGAWLFWSFVHFQV